MVRQKEAKEEHGEGIQGAALLLSRNVCFWASSYTFHSLGLGSGSGRSHAPRGGTQWGAVIRDVLGPSNTRTTLRTFMNYHTVDIARVLSCLIFAFFLFGDIIDLSNESYRVTIINPISVPKQSSQISCRVPLSGALKLAGIIQPGDETE